MIQGTINEQYSRLHDYIAALKDSNPNTTVVIQGEGPGARRFLRIYICLGSCKKGFVENCRPIIGMDGCHLKGPNGGQILAAVGLDGNNSMYPIAYAVVEGENKKSWMWFIELLQEDINFGNSHAWTFITDKQKGLVPALEALCPNSELRFCVRHLYDNFKKNNKGLALKEQLYKCAKATTVPAFEMEMQALYDMDSAAVDWLKDKPPQQWSKSHFRTWSKSDMLLNNLSESFNSLILEARDKPIITMLEKIRSILMKRIHVNAEKMRKQAGPLCPKIHEILERTKDEASYCVPEYAGDAKFQVMGPSGQFKCDLNALTCACRRWDLTGLPCCHGMSAMFYAGSEPESCVSHWYHKETYMKLYNNYIQPMDGPEMWPKTGMNHFLPPDYNRGVGRPTKNRKLGQNEKKKKTAAQDSQRLGRRYQVSLKCSKCKQMGHNKRSCKVGSQKHKSKQRVNRQSSHQSGSQPSQPMTSQPSKPFTSQPSKPFTSSPASLISQMWSGDNVFIKKP